MEKVLFRIRETRLERGYSREYIATRLDISQKSYCNIENGKSKIDLKRFFLISEILELDIILIFTEQKVKLAEAKNCDDCNSGIRLIELHERIKYQETLITFLKEMLRHNQK